MTAPAVPLHLRRSDYITSLARYYTLGTFFENIVEGGLLAAIVADVKVTAYRWKERNRRRRIEKAFKYNGSNLLKKFIL